MRSQLESLVRTERGTGEHNEKLVMKGRQSKRKREKKGEGRKRELGARVLCQNSGLSGDDTKTVLFSAEF